ncbi:MAG: chromate transporter [Rikenellaceae bacterium]
MIYLELFYCYLKIGFFGFGGGYTMLSLIQHEVVINHGWITSAALSDIIAISQMTPGPIAINSATYIGYTVAGFWGSVIATGAVCLPSLSIMVLITRFFLKLKDSNYMDRIMTAMRPAVIGMIAAASMQLIFPEDQQGASMIDIWSWGLFAAAFAASLRRVNPINLILLSAVAGIAIYYLPTVINI